MTIFMLQLLRKSKFDNDNFNGKQISNRVYMYDETFIAVSLQVYALQKNINMNFLWDTLYLFMDLY